MIGIENPIGIGGDPSLIGDKIRVDPRTLDPRTTRWVSSEIENLEPVLENARMFGSARQVRRLEKRIRQLQGLE